MAKKSQKNTEPSEPCRLLVPISDAKDLLVIQIEKGRQIATTPIGSEGQLEQAKSQYQTWSEYNQTLLSQIFSTDEETNKYTGGGFFAYAIGSRESLGEKIERFTEKLTGKIRLLESLVERLPLYSIGISTEKSGLPAKLQTPGIPVGSKKVFIIHGHDETNLLRLKELLKERWSLTPVVMKGEPAKGRALIEKFEQVAETCEYSIALLTPDDIINVEANKDYAQARPNVIFELGWFYARLGRYRVCILSKKGTQIHSDISGIERIEFSDDIAEQGLRIEDELRAAGIIV